MARLTAEQIAGIVKAGGPPAGTTIAEWVWVARKESRFNTDAVSPTGCCIGPWQINVRANRDLIPETKVSIANGKSAMRSAPRNFFVAKQIYARQGWDAWDVVKGPKPTPTEADKRAARNPDPSAVAGSDIAPGPEKGVEAQSVLDLFTSSPQFFGAIFPGIAAAASWLGDPANWIRIVEVVGGGVLVITAANIVIRPFIEPAIKQASSALPAGRLAKLMK